MLRDAQINKLQNEAAVDGQAGFSLVEIIITMTIFLMVLAAIFGTLRAGNVLKGSVENRSEIVANGRTAMNMMGREAVNAGLAYSKTGGVVPDDFAFDLMKIPKDPDSGRDIFPGVMAGNNISASDISVNGEKNDVIAFITRDMAFNKGASITIIDYGDFEWNPYLTTNPSACIGCKQHDLYLIEAADGMQALAMATAVKSDTYITLAEGDPLKLNRYSTGVPDVLRTVLKNCGPGNTVECFNYTPHATLKRVFLTSYGVGVDGTLNRTVYGNNTGGTAADQIRVQPMAFGVQSFQVRYLMKDGTQTDDPSNGNTNQMRLNDVVQVEISVTIASKTQQAGVTSVQLINLDSTFSMRNLRYDFE